MKLVHPYACILIVTIAVNIGSHSFGSSDPVFIDYRQVSSSGQHYIVVRRLGGPIHEEASGPVEILIAERRQNTPPVAPARGIAELIDPPPDWEWWEAIEVKATVGIRDGDRIVGRVKLSKSPREILISAKGKGIVCVDQHGMNIAVQHDGPALRYYSISGSLNFEMRLRDIFSKDEIDRFDTGSYGISWFQHAWLDEQRNEVVVIAAEKTDFLDHLHGLTDAERVRVIHLGNKSVRVGSANDILRAIKTRNSTGLREAILLSTKMGLKDAIPELEDIVRCSADVEVSKSAKTALMTLKNR